MNSKDQLREEIAAKRKALDLQWVETSSRHLIDRFQALEAFKSSEVIALYKALRGEVNLDAFFTTCWNMGKRTCIPIFNEELRFYEMAEVTESTPFRMAHYGIREPVEPSLIKRAEIDLIAVPGVGFDPKGNRLGRGGGYYDRLLNGFSGFSIGIAFDFQVVPQVRAENHDQRVRAIVTETKYIKV